MDKRRIVTDDRLVQRRWDGTKLSSHGKRVGKDCPLTRGEIRSYVLHNSAVATGHIRRRIDPSFTVGGLRKALNLLNKARGANRAR